MLTFVEKPPFPKPPKAIRLPLRKQMTIALGLVGTDGIVVAADTEESYGAMKLDTTKIIAVDLIVNGQPSPASGACIITSAGHSAYVTSLGEKLAHVFFADAERIEPPLQRAFEDCLVDFYERHVIPFENFPEDERPDAEMLVAYRRANVSRLLYTEKSIIAAAPKYKAVGAGSPFAEKLLEKVWRIASTESLEVVAAYTVFMVKDAIRSCGRFTQIATLRTSNAGAVISRMPMARVDELEKEFRSKWIKAEQGTLWKLLTQSVSQKSEPEP